jgi:hypothetical protein
MSNEFDGHKRVTYVSWVPCFRGSVQRHRTSDGHRESMQVDTLNSCPHAFAVSLHRMRPLLRIRESMAPFAPMAPTAAALLAAAVFLWPAPAHALDPDLKKPYNLQVVLHVADNRFLTPLFQEQLERELRDHLHLTFGALARVEVVRGHPLLGEVRDKGLQQALDGWEELSDRKTHFVLLDFRDGRYELQARQHDGKTGLNSPVVRRDATSDRLLVAQKAARLVERDFGLVGTVMKPGKEVQLALQGGGLGVPLGRWIKPGDVFAIARITRQGDKLRATRLPWAVLQVIAEPRDGICRCRFFHRFQGESLSEAGQVLGHRCLKLATTTAPVRLRLIDDKDFRPLDGWEVHIRSAPGQKAVQRATNREGLAISNEPFAHLAFVEVIKGGDIRAQFPVELVDERTVVCRLRTGVKAESQEALELRKDLWVRRIYDELRVVADRTAELNGLMRKSLDHALTSAQDGLKSLGEELGGLDLERIDIQRQASAQELKAALDLREGEQRLDDLRARHKEMERFVSKLATAIKEQTLATNVIQVLGRARLSEEAADFDQAIALYEEALKLKAEPPRIAAHLDRLKRTWEARSPAHIKARDFIYKTWPQLGRLELSALTVTKVKEARAAFSLCKDLGDTLTPRKLLLTNAIHAGNLKKRLDVLKRQVTEDNETEAQTIARVAEELNGLHTEVRSFLSAAKKN